jgi:dnd system-associated protein 4
MALARVPVAQDKASFVKALRAKEDGTGLFLSYADILTLAAAIGFQNKKRVPIQKIAHKDPDAVLQEQFRDPSIIKLIALADTQDPKILAPDEECDRLRVQIFQEYVNGGLELLSKELYGVSEPLERTLLILYSERQRYQSDAEELDLENLF